MATETWQLDNTHSSIGFTVRHMVVAKVHGRFRKYEGKLTLDGGNLESAKVAATIDANSIDTEVEGRDAHLRSPDFFDVAAFPTLTFQSTKFEKVGADRFRVTGDLTIRGITRPVEIDTELLGKFTDPFGNEKIALSGKTSIERKSFGLNWNKALETGGVLVGDRIDIQLEVQAVRVAAAEKAA